MTVPAPFDLPIYSLDFHFHNFSTMIKLTCTTGFKKEALCKSALPFGTWSEIVLACQFLKFVRIEIIRRAF